MAIPQSKIELLNAISTNSGRLLNELNNVPLTLVHEKSLDGHAKGTHMSVADLVSYLIGWNELVLKWLRQDAAGEAIHFPAEGFKWNELGRLAQKFYLDYEGLSYPQLLKRLSTTTAQIISLVESRDNADLYVRRWYGKWTMGRMIQLNTSSPYENSRGRLRSWLRTRAVPQET